MNKVPKKNRSKFIDDIENLNIDETLENLDKGSPHLNWGYLLIGLIVLFLLVWGVLEIFSPNETEAHFQSQTEQIKELENKVNHLEYRVKQLEDKE
ncbi:MULTISPECIES: hypothetical protein [Aerococcus]|uniref:Uncharacterized protein n=4 Tax=Aerococcus TaxID=1375 RepID=A0A1E9PPV8_9LACT|nr:MULTISPECIES: hypothetical protein [Aerococcus]KAA9218400.1 hypothetical protein F6I39_07320 [Aerococcus loyolae]KAA9235238.1 hypothetical protein F6I37_01385 [Aerococcus mictus]KAA9241496.1 hypothetical protein F6I34_02630 [Aerococcus urinae]KAA9266959.1 hypothetical protein F6I19_00785 [Aerococcus loyolae]KAA9292859.1 hypothetical protein F6I06_02405 [Aerococcus mictus]